MSLQEVSQLFLQNKTLPPNGGRFFNNEISPEYLAILYYGLTKNLVPADTVLILSVDNATTYESLIPISMALVHQPAIANSYFQNEHILIYTFKTLNHNVPFDLVKMCFWLIVDAGGNLNDWATTRHDITVIEWFTDRGLTVSASTSLTNEQKTDLGVLLDLEGNYSQKYIYLATKCRSGLLNKLVRGPVSVKPAICWLNADAYNVMIVAGSRPHYIHINNILVLMLDYNKVGLYIPYNELQNILIISINVGYVFDQDQWLLVSSLPTSSYAVIKATYDKPRWKKACKSKAPLPILFKRLGLTPERCINKEYNQQALITKHKEEMQQFLNSHYSSLKDRNSTTANVENNVVLVNGTETQFNPLDYMFGDITFAQKNGQTYVEWTNPNAISYSDAINYAFGQDPILPPNNLAVDALTRGKHVSNQQLINTFRKMNIPIDVTGLTPEHVRTTISSLLDSLSDEQWKTYRRLLFGRWWN